MDKDMQEFVDTVGTWAEKRIPLATAFTKDGLAEFAATHNALTRKIISQTQRKDPEFWSAMLELAQNASTMTVGGKLFVNGADRTNS